MKNDRSMRAKADAKMQGPREPSVAEKVFGRAFKPRPPGMQPNIVKAFQQIAASHFLGDADPVTKMGQLLRAPNAVATMKQLGQMTANNPIARAGLQRAVADFTLRDLRSNADAGGTGAIKPEIFQTFINKSAPALKEIMTPEQFNTMSKVAADLKRAQQSINGTKLAGGSNTAQDLAAGAKHGGGQHQSALTQVVIAEAVGAMAEHAMGPLGQVGTVGTIILNAVRQAGLKRFDDLVTNAMLNPALAKTLLTKVQKPATGECRRIDFGATAQGVFSELCGAGVPNDL